MDGEAWKGEINLTSNLCSLSSLIHLGWWESFLQKKTKKPSTVTEL